MTTTTKELLVAHSIPFENPQQAEDYWIVQELRERPNVEPFYSVRNQEDGLTIVPIDHRTTFGLVVEFEEPNDDLRALVGLMHILGKPVLAYAAPDLSVPDIFGTELEHETPPGNQGFGHFPNAEYVRISADYKAISVYRGKARKLKLTNWLYANITKAMNEEEEARNQAADKRLADYEAAAAAEQAPTLPIEE